MSTLLQYDVESSDAQPTGKRPRLLFLCQTLPFPPDGGVNIRSFNILRLLARSFDITALCFFRKGSRPSEESVAASVAGLQPYAKVQAFSIAQEHSRSRWFLDHVRSAVSGKSYTQYAYESEKFRRVLVKLLMEERFDVVHVDSLDLAGYLPKLRGLPVICTHHNVESALLARRAEVEPSGLKRRYFRHQARLIQKDEEHWCPRVRLNVAVSERDAATLTAIAPRSRVVVIPNGVDTSIFRPSETNSHGLVFVGGHGWFPNRDAMQFFATEIWPMLKNGGAPPRMTWVGRSPTRVQEDYARRFGITVTGYVDDVRPYVQDAACYVAPIRTGGGTRLKILDAWAMGKAVVSTSIGCEGLAAVDGENILIRDSATGFAQAVRDVLHDAQLRSDLGRAARNTALQCYDWEVIGASLTRAYVATVADFQQASST